MEIVPTGRAFRAALLSTVALAASALSAAAQQQTAQTQNIEEIVVTGTRIQREDLIAASPIAVISSADIRASGTISVEEYMRYAPQMAQAYGSNTNNANPGAATADLRRLGTSRTLVLVDGKGFPPYDPNGAVDLNNIPVSLIDRVDIVTGGASSVYGSDAIAGVVNFILKRNFKGVEGDVQYGLSEHGDSIRWNMNSTAGGDLGDGRGNFVINVDYTENKALYQGSRPFSVSSLDPSDFGPGGSSTAEENTVNGLTPAAGVTDSTGRAQFNSSGNLVPLFSLFNFNPYNLLQAPLKKWTATALGHYSISDDIEFYTNATFTDSRVETIVAPTGTFGFPFDINYATNPFLNAQAKGVLGQEDTAARGDPNPGDGIVTLGLGRRLTEVGTRNSVYEGSTYRVVNGLKGDFGDKNQYHWDVFGQYGRTLRTIEYQNDFNYAKLQQAILVVNNAAGQPVCQDTTGGCAPANIWGKGNLSPQAASFIRFNLEETDVATQLVAGGSVSGDLPFQVGDAKAGGFAGGIEYRREESQTRPDDNLVNGNAPGFGSSTPVNAKYDVKEFYGEAIVPLLEGREGVKSLNIEGGVRYADYNSIVVGIANNSFSNVSWKVGGDWAPEDIVRLRAMYQRAVRAPNIQEIGLPRTPGTGDASNDPCSGTGPVGNATLTALCIATGVPAARIGQVSGPISGQVNNYLGGNPFLTPERAKTLTLGAVFTPERYIPRLTATIDYYDIKVNNAIIQIPEQAVLDACYTIDKSASSPFCQRVHRNPLNGSLSGGTETGVDAAYLNAANYRAQGVDFSVHYGMDLPNEMGSLNLGVDGTYVISSKEQDASFLPERDCVGLAGLVCKRPDMRWRFTQTTGWTYGPLDLQMHIRFFSGLTQDSIKLAGASYSDFVKPTIPAYAYLDLQGSYAFNDHLTVRAGITNLTDKDPPVVGTGWGGTAENSGNTLPATYDPIGRAFYFGATVRF